MGLIFIWRIAGKKELNCGLDHQIEPANDGAVYFII